MGDRAAPSSNAPLVVHIIYRLDFGGLENGLVNLINHMPQRRHRHAIVCLAGFSDFKNRIRRSDVQVLSIDRKPGKDLPSYWRLFRLLRRMRPDIVHTRNLGTIDLQWVAWAAGVKHRVHGEHGWEASDLTGSNTKNLRIRQACRRAIHRYVTVSQHLADWVRDKVGVPAARITQIYNGVDAEKFAPRGPLPADFPWSRADVFVFGTVGRMDPIKNHVALVDAFATTARQSDRARLVIVGAGPLAQAVRDRVAELGLSDRVWLPGARNDVAELIRSFDVFVLPSLNEGISNTILEAMASGKPVIAGRVGGNVELIEQDVTGRLYDSTSPQALSEALQSYCGGAALVEAQGATARQRALSRYSLGAMVSGYADVYDQLMARA